MKHPAKRSRLAVAATSAAAFVGIAGTLAAHAHGSSSTTTVAGNDDTAATAATATPGASATTTPVPDTVAPSTDNGFAATPAAPSYQGPTNGSYSTQHARSRAS